MKSRFIGLQRDRLDALVDAVYAIALTMLVLDVKLPLANGGFGGSYILHELVPKLVAYGIAFATVALCWVGHYYFSTVVRYTDYIHVILNLVPLAFVALVPFPAAALGTYPDSSLAVAAYASNAMIISLLYLVNWRFVRHLIPQNVGRRLLAHIGAAIWLLVILEGSALALAFVKPVLGIGMAAAVIPFGFTAVGLLAPRIVRAHGVIESQVET
ncbi:MAG TPA: TMEM175 family protein [Candidatus Nitrosotalea sp.]|nr:TMEM175 family protein [Candidatus Nitrosotalea sp.]